MLAEAGEFAFAVVGLGVGALVLFLVGRVAGGEGPNGAILLDGMLNCAAAFTAFHLLVCTIWHLNHLVHLVDARGGTVDLPEGSHIMMGPIHRFEIVAGGLALEFLTIHNFFRCCRRVWHHMPHSEPVGMARAPRVIHLESVAPATTGVVASPIVPAPQAVSPPSPEDSSFHKAPASAAPTLSASDTEPTKMPAPRTVLDAEPASQPATGVSASSEKDGTSGPA
jgi:hypothetical protein